MARRGYSLLFAAGLFVSDSLAIVTGFFATFLLRFHYHQVLPFIPRPIEIPPPERYAEVLPTIVFVMILMLRAGGLYRESLSFVKIVRVGSVFRQVFMGVFILIALSAFYREVSFSRLFGLMLIPIFTFLVVLGRMILVEADVHVRQVQGKKRRLLIVGGAPVTLDRLTRSFRTRPFAGYHLLGCIAGESVLSKDQSLPVLGLIRDMESLLDKHTPDELILCSSGMDHETVTELIASCDRRMIQFYIVPDVFNLLTSRVEITSVGGVNLLGLEVFPLDNGLNRAIKRIMDILGALCGIFIFAPLALLFICVIRCSGPVLFKQVRCREDGNEFEMYKFRTMHVDAEKMTGPVFTAKDDPRCTRMGFFLRQTNLDELPQLINVLQGHMSLVGPRPERPHFIEQFKSEIPRYMNRHHIKPGLTGWAQVNGLRGNTSLDERLKYDLYYIENWSVWLDIKILFLTVFSYKNAY